MKPYEVKEILSNIISALSDNSFDFLQNPSKDFSRNRKLSFETIIKMMIGMGGNSLCKEIYDWFNYSEDTASVSAFVQLLKWMKQGRICLRWSPEISHNRTMPYETVF
jgi:hypothetical protein